MPKLKVQVSGQQHVQKVNEGICGIALQVPAYFDEDQKNATITAGNIAGLQTVRLIRQCSP